MNSIQMTQSREKLMRSSNYLEGTKHTEIRLTNDEAKQQVDQGGNSLSS